MDNELYQRVRTYMAGSDLENFSGAIKRLVMMGFAFQKQVEMEKSKRSQQEMVEHND